MSWTADQSSLLSLLLDEVVGTQEMIDIRQDCCRLWESLRSAQRYSLNYFTGSAAEGLELPGSDLDFMGDVNIDLNAKVFQTIHEIDETNLYTILVLCTENVPPGFALLQCVNICSHSTFPPCFKNINDIPYVSSDKFIQCFFDYYNLFPGSFQETRKRQGPSIERWSLYDDESKSGTDNVPCFHCTFWPNGALEWTQRPRYFGWPSSHDLSSIISFGCHIVPIGHPLSKTKSEEWRISFSVAERTLVWSFNHVQMQCYAVMKIIFKEFIKLKCSPQNYVLCSYFIKTFLFWTYETTNSYFWCLENFRDCVKFLLIEFSKCIHEGVLRHYFIPRFNLLSVKLTREAQTELLSLFDMVIQYDISTMRECRTLQGAMTKLLSATENRASTMSNIKRRNVLLNNGCLVDKSYHVFNECISSRLCASLSNVVDSLLPLVCKTPAKSIVLKRILQLLHMKPIMSPFSDNRKVYHLHKTIDYDALSTDISTCKLWYAFFLLKKGDYTSTLSTVNQMLSNIAPFALYCCCQNPDHWGSAEAKDLFVHSFIFTMVSYFLR